jgi:hypothetical protein
VNMVQILCTFVCKYKMIPAETAPWIGDDKGEQWREWIQVWYSWYTVRTIANATMYPTQHNNKGQKNLIDLFVFFNKCQQ